MRELSETSARGGRAVRCVASILVPADEAVFHFFDASSERAVLDVCAAAQLGVDRIVEVVAIGRGSGEDSPVPQAHDAA